MLTAKDRWRLLVGAIANESTPHVNVNMFQSWYNWKSVDLDIKRSGAESQVFIP